MNLESLSVAEIDAVARTYFAKKGKTPGSDPSARTAPLPDTHPQPPLIQRDSDPHVDSVARLVLKERGIRAPTASEYRDAAAEARRRIGKGGRAAVREARLANVPTMPEVLEQFASAEADPDADSAQLHIDAERLLAGQGKRGSYTADDYAWAIEHVQGESLDVSYAKDGDDGPDPLARSLAASSAAAYIAGDIDNFDNEKAYLDALLRAEREVNAHITDHEGN